MPLDATTRCTPFHSFTRCARPRRPGLCGPRKRLAHNDSRGDRQQDLSGLAHYKRAADELSLSF
jgi:hypothetical protein